MLVLVLMFHDKQVEPKRKCNDARRRMEAARRLSELLSDPKEGTNRPSYYLLGNVHILGKHDQEL